MKTERGKFAYRLRNPRPIDRWENLGAATWAHYERIAAFDAGEISYDDLSPSEKEAERFKSLEAQVVGTSGHTCIVVPADLFYDHSITDADWFTAEDGGNAVHVTLGRKPGVPGQIVVPLGNPSDRRYAVSVQAVATKFGIKPGDKVVLQNIDSTPTPPSFRATRA